MRAFGAVPSAVVFCGGLWLVALVAGCASETLPGLRFSVTLTGVDDTCNDPQVQYAETFEYRLVIESSQVTVFTGEDLFASGTIQGCALSYESSAYTDERGDGMFVRWRAVGEAQVAAGGELCDAGDGWLGEESIQVAESTDPDVERGCSFTMISEGSFLGEGE